MELGVWEIWNLAITLLDQFFMPFNWIPIVAMLKLILAITIVAIMTKMVILATAIGVIKMAILGIQLKSINKLAQWRLTHINRTCQSDTIKKIFYFVIFFSLDGLIKKLINLLSF